MPSNIKNILLHQKILRSLNSDWRSYFQDLSDYVLPRKAWITTVRSRGERVHFNFLYDDTAISGLQVHACGMYTNLTNGASIWHGTESKNKRKNQSVAARKYFYDVNDAIRQKISDSNFDTVIQEFYVDDGGFGTGVVLSMEKAGGIGFQNVPIEQADIVEDGYGDVVAVYRTFQLTAIQAHMMWGDKAGPSVTEKIKADKYEDKLDFIHYVGPREYRDFNKIDNLNKPFESVWINVKDERLVYESGFDDFPYHIGKYYESGEPFGFSPAMMIFPSIKLSNAMNRTLLRHGMMLAAPPFQVPSRGYMTPYNFNPDAINVYNAAQVPPADRLSSINVGGNSTLNLELIKRVEDKIENGLFVPLFRSLADITKRMTAEEVQRRIMENMGLLGPVVGRHTAVIKSMLYRAFSTMQRKGELPRPPDELIGEEPNFVFLGPLAKAQRESELVGTNRFLTMVAGMAQIQPEVIDNINGDETINIISEISAINPRLLRGKTDVDAIRKQRAQQQQTAQQLDMAHKAMAIGETGAKGAKHLAGAV